MIATHTGLHQQDGHQPLVVAVDIGTTSTKTGAHDTHGHEVACASRGYMLREPHRGHAEQDPFEILEAVLQTVAEVTATVGARRVRGVSFSSAMHSLIGLDQDLTPLTQVVTWADTRAREQAERLRASPGGIDLHRRTGTPLHPMAPLPKLVWFRERQPELFEKVRFWVSIKDFVLLHLTGALVVDISLGSASGLMDCSTLRWDREALRIAGITPSQLPELVSTTHVLEGLTEETARRTGLRRDTHVVVGAGDGPLANLGVGAVRPGVAACSIGTSGALRLAVDRPAVDPLGGVFSYAITENRWVVGGAINNGGAAMQWARDVFAPEIDEHDENAVLDLAERAHAGSGGLLVLPYLLSERAPHWSSLPRGAFVGLTRVHRREHMIRAVLEGVCLQLALVQKSMRGAGLEIDEVRATGGVFRGPLWRTVLAAALGSDIGFTGGQEGSGFGAAVLGMQALGLIESIDVVTDLVSVESVTHPDPSDAAVYASLLPVFDSLFDALVPAHTELWRLAPMLPVELGGLVGVP